MKKKNKQNIFIYISIIFIFGLICIYTTRFIYFKVFAPKINNTITDLKDRVLKQMILEKDKDYYYFSGKTNGNYVIYSSQLWQIIRLNDQELTLISTKPITNLSFTTNYKESIINDFLNNDFYNILNKDLIIDTKTCINEIVNAKDDCSETFESKVSLLSLNLYEKAGGKNSYINNGFYTYLSNEGDNHYYIDDNGEVNETTSKNLYGIKPIITIKSSNIISGNGMRNDPYILDTPKVKTNDIYVGSYIQYKDLLWRVIDNSDTVKLIANDVVETIECDVEEFNENSKIYNYLNLSVLNKIDSKYIRKTTFYNGSYDKNTKIISTTLESYVGIPYIFDLYLNDVDNYSLMTYSKYTNSQYVIKNNGISYKEEQKECGIRPLISLKNNLKISGSGTINNPYIIEGDLDEEAKN